MPTKTTAQMTATLRLRRRAAVTDGSEAGGSEDALGDIAAEPHNGDDEDQGDEQEQSQRQGDVAAAPRLGRRLGLPAGIAHLNSSRGCRPTRCSTSRVAKISVR